MVPCMISFLYYPSVLLHFLFYILFCNYVSGLGNHQEHTLEVFNRTDHNVMKDTISYAHIQSNNAYYKEVLGQKMNKKLSY
jgi:hypothetical protein